MMNVYLSDCLRFLNMSMVMTVPNSVYMLAYALQAYRDTGRHRS